MIKNDIKQLVVLNEIRSKLEMLHSDIIPESEEHTIVDAMANVASNVFSVNGSSYGSAYTTRPLVPTSGSVLDFSQSFLYDVFNFNFGIYSASNIYADIYMMFGPNSSTTIYDKLYFLINDTTIWSTQYNRTEGRAAALAMPSSETNYSQEYATIDKLLDGAHSTMKIIKIPKSNPLMKYTDANVRADFYRCYIYNLRFDIMTDLNSLCVPFSNIEYTCYNYGALILRTFYDKIHEAMCYFVLPTSTSISYAKTASATNTIATQNGNSILTLNPVQWLINSPVQTVTGQNKYYLNMEGKEQWIPVAIPISMTLTDGSPNTWSSNCPITNTKIDTTSGAASTGTNVSEAKYLSIPIAFCLNPGIVDGKNYTRVFELLESQIAQTTFDIEPSSKRAMEEYFASVGKICLPIQTFSTSTLNNGTVGPTSGSSTYPPQQLVGNISGNNFSNVLLVLTPIDSPSTFVNPYVQDYSMLLNGKNLNPTAYPKVNNRVIKDYTNACCDTDTDEINTDYLYSLQFPPEIVSFDDSGNCLAFSSANQYFINGDFNTMKTMNWNSSMNKYIKNPNGFMHVYQLEIPDSYHTGYSIVEMQPMLTPFKFIGTYNSTYREMTDPTQCRFVNNEKQYDASTNTCNLYSATNLTIPSYVNRDCTFYVIGLCDALIYLDYDPGVNSCTGGGLSYASPYVPA